MGGPHRRGTAVSSTYRLICLSHDPGLVLDRPEWSSTEAAVAATSHMETWGHSIGCDVVVGRYSYPLIEVICRGGRARLTHSLHTDDLTIAAGWLRLLAHVRENDAAADALVGSAAACWPPARLDRLVPLLGMEERLERASAGWRGSP